MKELHEIEAGSVYTDCQCTPGETVTTPIPEICLSPTGDDCLKIA